MKALVFTAVREVSVRDEPEPAPRPDQAVVEVAAAGICGSDLSGFTGHSPRRRPPLILGHEAVGVVVSLPPGEWPVRVGDRVALNPLQTCGVCDNCRDGKTNICAAWTLIGMDREPGAFASRVAVAARNLLPIGPDFSDEQAVLIEPLAVAVHAVQLISMRAFATIAIYGMGTQGILLLQLAKRLGFRKIAAVDTNPARLSVAGELGADLLVNPRDGTPQEKIAAWSDGGVDVGIEATGVSAARVGLIDAVRKGGEIILLGNHDESTDVPFNLIVRKELRLQGSYAYTAADFRTSLRLLESGDVTLAPWTVTQPLEEGQAAFDMLVTDPGATLKVLLRP